MRNRTLILTTLLFVLISLLHSENIKALLILPKYFGLNTHLCREMINSYGWEITTAAVGNTVTPCTFDADQGAAVYPVDKSLDKITDITIYDVIIIASSSWLGMGANAYLDLKNSPQCKTLLQQANSAGIIISATCGGMRVLAASNIINGVRVTGKAGPGNVFLNEVTAAGGIYVGQNIQPVIDGNIVTSTRGQFYSRQNFEAIVLALEKNAKKRRKGK